MPGLLRIPLLFVIWICYEYGTTPPMPPPSTKEKERRASMGFHLLIVESLTRAGLPRIKRIFVAIVIAIEGTFALATHFHTSPWARIFLTTFCNAPTVDDDSATLTASLSPGFVLGAALVIAGAAVRAWTYRALGRLFTYEVAIRDGHHLVTSGPYAFVRHPSYVATQLMAAGLTVAAAAPGSWWTETQMAQTALGKLMTGTWAAMSFYSFLLLARAPVEDAMLKREFGKEWEAYAGKVRYWFIPGLI